MTGPGPRQEERTLGRGWGKPYGRRGSAWPDVRDGLARVLAVLGVVIATFGVVTAAMKIPEPGIDFEALRGPVLSVLPGGPAWHAGIRAGQTVVGITTGESELDWVLQTRGAGLDHYLTIRGATAELRGTTPLALGALLMALLAVAGAFRRPRGAAAAASLAGAVGTVPLMFGGHAVISSIGGLLMLGLPVAWLVAVGLRQGGLRALVLAGAVLAAIGWLAARLAAPSAYDPIDAGRLVASAGAALATVGLSLDRSTLSDAVGSIDAPMALDLFGIALAGGLALALWLVAGVSPAMITIALSLGALVYLRSRRPLVRLLDRLLLGERLERASVNAIESERARVARELHDEPLQELSAAIRRLETTPEPQAEARRLREVASHLRSVTTDLRPPVLDDLGLGPAMLFLADQANANGSAVRVETTIDDETGRDATERLPPEVELAVYRIVQEAIANAQRHSGGTIVEVVGELTPDRIDLVVRDDGVGLSREATERAERGGHLGLPSMRQRAAVIRAELNVGQRAEGGTAVVVRWRRP